MLTLRQTPETSAPAALPLVRQPDEADGRRPALGRAVRRGPHRGQPAAGPSWRAGLPTLTGLTLALRELRTEDAPALFQQLTTDEVTRFISPPPTSVEGFEQFIVWAHQRRAQGRYACFAVVPRGHDRPVGLFQLQLNEQVPGRAEWGFVLAAPYWGRGLFLAGALLLLQFAFATVGIRCLHARACLANGRGTGALRKVRARLVRVLPQAFTRHGRTYDQASGP